MRAFWLLFLIFILSGKSFAQITASDSSGCAPLVSVAFTSPPGATTFNWNFDDGTGSNLAAPNHTFILPGTYNVQFTGLVGGNTVNYSLTINVYGKPSGFFSATPPLSGCVPLTVDFSDSSTGGGGTNIVKWEWAFGDGGVNVNNPNPSYTYTIPGAFTVSLKVTDANGCDTSIAKLNYIMTSIPPNSVITTTPAPPTSCLPPLMVAFNASNSSSNSTTGSGLTYLWDFGSGNTSTVAFPPAINYTTSGVFPVTLTVTDNNNCPATTITNVVISAPVASFNAVNAVNDTVCSTVTFHNTSIGANPVFNYGDGTQGTDTIHTYPGPGNYQVTLQVSAGTCVDDTTISIVVQNVVASFTTNPSYSCSWPYTVQHTNTSINGSTYQWMFGDSTFSSQVNPTHVYQLPDTNQYTIYYDFWHYYTSLTITSIYGCKDSIIVQDSVFKPTARFMPDKSTGCAPLTVSFSDSSISNESIVNYYWIFGDGAINNGTLTNVSHTYNTPGIYNVRLIITNSAGCKDTSFIIPIYVGEPSAPAFNISPTTVCVNTPVQFTDQTAASDSAQYWHYTADGGYMWHCYTEPNPTYSFNNVTGPQSVTLTTVYNGCEGSTTIPNAITVNGPLAHFYSQGNCATPFTYVFHGNFQEADYWQWDFGDGTVLTNSNNPNPSHTYTTTGDYNVVLTAFSNSTGCAPYVDTVLVHVRDIQASMISDSLTCTLQENVFSGGTSNDVYGHCYEGYLYYWGDNTPPHNGEVPTATHTYTDGGVYTITLIVTDINGCVDSTKKAIRVYDVTAHFKTNKIFGCLPLTVNFSDSSYADTTITQWQWSFGDGATSNLQNPTHTYTQTGVYYWIAKLVVTDILGCRDSMTMIITPSVPDSGFYAQTSTNICVGSPVTFMANSNIVTYHWNFGDGHTSSLMNPTNIYQVAGNYTVSLTVTDSISCQGTKTIVQLVSVQNYPLAGFVSSVDTMQNKCYPLLVNFTDTSIVNVFGSRNWDLGNGSSTVGSQTVGTIYQTPGTYNVTLIETTTNGCKDTATKSITVVGPVGDFNIVPDTICKGQSITFTIKDTVDVIAYSWDFGDGSTAIGTSPIIHPFYINPLNGQTQVSLVLWSPDSACTATVSHIIYIQPVIADFSITGSDTIYCLNEPVEFNNMSLNTTQSVWHFGDGASYTGLTPPPHTFPGPGSYSVTLNVSNNTTGCSDTLVRDILIYGIPDAQAAGGDTCQGSAVQLSASGGISYVWTPSATLSDDSISNPLASPNSTTNYIVTVADANGCVDTASALVIIYEPPDEVHYDTTIVIGETVQLNAYQGPGYSYLWTPSTGLSCTTCPDPVAQPLVNTSYSVIISDDAGCFTITSTYDFDVKPLTTIDVPTAFTPNGDGDNDVIYVNGLGIKKLIEFKIYNRWGQLVFETTDLKEGWNGYYMGKLQNVETYVYFASVETWLAGKILTKKGSFNLIR